MQAYPTMSRIDRICSKEICTEDVQSGPVQTETSYPAVRILEGPSVSSPMLRLSRCSRSSISKLWDEAESMGLSLHSCDTVSQLFCSVPGTHACGYYRSRIRLTTWDGEPHVANICS